MVEQPKIIPKSFSGRQNSLTGKSMECQFKKKEYCTHQHASKTEKLLRKQNREEAVRNKNRKILISPVIAQEDWKMSALNVRDVFPNALPPSALSLLECSSYAEIPNSYNSHFIFSPDSSFGQHHKRICADSSFDHQNPFSFLQSWL